MKNNNKITQIGAIILLLMLLLTSFAQAGTYEEDIQPSVTMTELNWFTKLFAGGNEDTSFSTSRASGSIIPISAGERFDATFYVQCNEAYASTSHKFSFAYLTADEYNSGSTSPDRNVFKTFTVEKACVGGMEFKVTVANVPMSTLPDSVCGSTIFLMIKHERNLAGVPLGYVLDTKGEQINGFEGNQAFTYNCVSNACEGKTGKLVGEPYCGGSNVYQEKYTTLVKNNECWSTPSIIERCDKCSNGACVDVLNGYVFKDNTCNPTTVSFDSKPSNFYNTMNECSANIIQPPDQLTGWKIVGEECIETQYLEGVETTGVYSSKTVCESDIFITCPTDVVEVCGADSRTYQNKCEAELAGTSVATSGQCSVEVIDDETGSPTNNSQDNDLNIFQKFWNWLKGLFN